MVNLSGKISVKLKIFLDNINSPCIRRDTNESDQYKINIKKLSSHCPIKDNDINNDEYTIESSDSVYPLYNKTQDYFVRIDSICADPGGNHKECYQNIYHYNAHTDMKRFIITYEPKSYSLKVIPSNKKITCKYFNDFGNIMVLTDTDTPKILYREYADKEYFKILYKKYYVNGKIITEFMEDASDILITVITNKDTAEILYHENKHWW